jgi:pyrroline-5-carboxylate reductase
MTYKTLFIGYGNMGRAIADSLDKQYQLEIVDPHAEQTKPNIHQSISSLPQNYQADITFFATKPQLIKEIISDYKPFLKEDTLIISILAGTKLDFFQTNLPQQKNFLRIMPNLASLKQQSVNLLYGKNLNEEQKTLSEDLTNSFGEAIWLEDENSFHAGTAISGSGPAYYFLFFELFKKYAKENNINENDAINMVLKTAEGALSIAKENNNFQDLINKVSSKGGTTEAAINEFNKDNILENIFQKALNAAKTRSEELSS